MSLSFASYPIAPIIVWAISIPPTRIRNSSIVLYACGLYECLLARMRARVLNGWEFRYPGTRDTAGPIAKRCDFSSVMLINLLSANYHCPHPKLM